MTTVRTRPGGLCQCILATLSPIAPYYEYSTYTPPSPPSCLSYLAHTLRYSCFPTIVTLPHSFPAFVVLFYGVCVSVA